MVLNDMLDKVDFVVGDLKTDDTVLPILLQYATVNGSFGVYAAADGAVMLKHGYHNAPVFFKAMEASYTYDSFTLVEGSIVKDPNSQNGQAYLHSTKDKYVNLFWVGPYVFLPPGEYEANFILKIDNVSEGKLLDLYVSCFIYKQTITYVGTNATGHNLRFSLSTNGTQDIQAFLSLNGQDFNQTGKYQYFPFKFIVRSFGAYEFRGTSLSNSTNIYFDGVRINQTKPLNTLFLEIQEFFPKT
jgi:hypothetical protein